MPRAPPTLAAVGQLADATVVDTVATAAAVAVAAAPDFDVAAGDAVPPPEPHALTITPTARAVVASQRGLLWYTGFSFHERRIPDPPGRLVRERLFAWSRLGDVPSRPAIEAGMFQWLQRS
jgi:hypothetical protein